MLASFLTHVQIAPTSPSDFLVHQGSAYVATPAFPVQPISAETTFALSSDGSQLACLYGSAETTPASLMQSLAKGIVPANPSPLGVWSRSTGRFRRLELPNDGKTVISDLNFLGRDLYFVTSRSRGHVLWYAPEGGSPRPLNSEGSEKSLSIRASRRGSALIVSNDETLWLATAGAMRPLPLPKGSTYLLRGVTENDQAIVWELPLSEPRRTLLINFSTGAVTRTSEDPVAYDERDQGPFIRDFLKNQPIRGENGIAEKIDAVPHPIASEDGGYRLDLVERTGARRRRLLFAPDLSPVNLKISGDGLTMAYVSNRFLYVRSLVKTDQATTRRLLGN